MSEPCDRILAADNRIIFAMIVDEEGQIHCEKTKPGEPYVMPKEMIMQVGGIWASVVGGIFKQLSEFNGPLEHAIVKNEKMTTIGMTSKKGYVIFATREENVQPLIEKVRKDLI